MCIISFCFCLYLIFYVCILRFDVTRNLEKNLGVFGTEQGRDKKKDENFVLLLYTRQFI